MVDVWDAKLRMQDDTGRIAAGNGLTGREILGIELRVAADKYAFIPAHPTLLSVITANFLHGGWLHLIGNMWFLWLAGAVLEDTWGRLIYPAFYLIAGVLAFQVHAMVNVGSFTPTIGASGAIAGLMGAFLVRFPTTKIEMGYLLFYRFYRFKMAAYWLLPLWLLTEILYGSVFGQTSGVAHWAHVGGFAFGALIAVAVQKSGLEQIAEKGIQEKISWVSHPLLAQASEQMEKKEFDQAAASLQKLLLEKPDSIDAYRMLQRIYWQKNDLPAQRDALLKLLSWKSRPTITKARCKRSRISEMPGEKNFLRLCGSNSAANWKPSRMSRAPRTNIWSWRKRIPQKSSACSRKWPRGAFI